MNFKPLSTNLLGLISLINITIGQTISGEIFVNNYNSPAIGAAIMIKGTNRGVLTDVEGKFSLKVNSADSILEISYTDYYSVELNLDTIEYVNLS